MTERPFRFSAMMLAALLGVQCIWILLAELSRPGIDRLPADASSAAAAANQRDAAVWAASIGGIRGDLWAEAAFTNANAMLDETKKSSNAGHALESALSDVGRALALAPVNSGAWLLLAGLSSRDSHAGIDSLKALKMSYYTGPSEQDLIPLRLRIVARTDFVNDLELREFVSRDVRLLLSRHQDSAIVAAYNAASSTGKPFIEKAVYDVAPSSNLLRQALPN